ncbi:hypothetical protein QFZ82_000202 [Streptomyces sp. V4I23]|nr:hypothetical protein [Streptomyces sp. V4I23]MDQ1005718.1 hypothetical protein [Streptomyces sp. V4I23]
MRHQVFLTDTPYGEGSMQHLKVRHRAHARVEDRIPCGKTTGSGRFPSCHFQINAAWLELSLTETGRPAGGGSSSSRSASAGQRVSGSSERYRRSGPGVKQWLRAVAVELGGRAGERLCRRLHLAVARQKLLEAPAVAAGGEEADPAYAGSRWARTSRHRGRV